MVFQVLVNFKDKNNKPLCVADTDEEFNNTTIRELKEKFKSQISGAPDPNYIRVVFGTDPLEDHQTLQFYRIKHLSLLLFVMKMPHGGDPPQPRGNESFGKVTETVGLLGWLGLGSSFASSRAEKEKIQERDSASQYKGATKPRSDADLYDYSKKWSDPSDASVRLRREEKKEKHDQPPAEASSVHPDADLQFLQSLLPALKRMDLRRREFAKASIQQLVFEIEFNPRFEPHGGMRRTNSKEHLPPKM